MDTFFRQKLPKNLKNLMCFFKAPSAKTVFFKKVIKNGYAFKTTHGLTFKNYPEAKRSFAASFSSQTKLYFEKKPNHPCIVK